MLIRDLEIGSTIAIHVTDGERAVQLSSTTIDLNKVDHKICKDVAKNYGYNSFACIQAVKARNCVVNLAGDNITCSITALKNKKPYLWKQVEIIRVKLPEYGTAHLVMSNDDVKTFNRRGEFRLFLGQLGTCILGTDHIAKSVFIKDISCSGIGMLFSKKDMDAVDINMHAEVHFSEVNDSGVSESFVLNAKIVRYLATGGDQVLIGCRILGKSPELEKLIYQKQRQSMSINNEIQTKRVLTRELKREMEAITNNAAES